MLKIWNKKQNKNTNRTEKGKKGLQKQTKYNKYYKSTDVILKLSELLIVLHHIWDGLQGLCGDKGAQGSVSIG